MAHNSSPGDRNSRGTGGSRSGPGGSSSGGTRGHRDNSSFGERSGKRYDRSGRRDDAGDSAGAGSHGAGGGRGGPRNGERPHRGGERRSAPGSHPGRGRQAESRPAEPPIPEDIEAQELDPDIRRDLRSLDKNNAEAVARHLVAAMYLVDGDPERALEHGRAAKARAGRIGVVRETLGVLAYRAGEWSEALGELRAARRISGGPGLLALMADCERGMGRPERAIEVARGEESRGVEGDELVELRIVEAGARMDMGQLDGALVTLTDAGLDAQAKGAEAARLDYAYAELLLAGERIPEAAQWFRNAVAADPLATDADERAAELEG